MDKFSIEKMRDEIERGLRSLRDMAKNGDRVAAEALHSLTEMIESASIVTDPTLSPEQRKQKLADLKRKMSRKEENPPNGAI
jgi:hypothetical protein